MAAPTRYLGGAQARLLPLPMANVLNGGVHADNNVDLQEFMVCPIGPATFADGIRAVAEVYQALKKVLHERKLGGGVGDEGGFAPELESNQEALDLLVEAIEKAGYTPGTDVSIALDPAASEFFRDGRYELAGRAGRSTPPASSTSTPAGSSATRSSRSRTAWRRTTGTAGHSSPSAWEARSSWSATTSSSPT